MSAQSPVHPSTARCYSYSLRNVINDNGAVCVPVVHGCERLVALLSCCVPDLEFDCRLLVEGEGLCEESGADCGLSVVIELILVSIVR
jgi:hypothetical protein